MSGIRFERGVSGAANGGAAAGSSSVLLDPSQAAVVQLPDDASASVLGSAPSLGGVPGATDGTVLTSRTGIPSVVYGPGGKWIAHQANEFVEVSEILSYCSVYADAATRFLSSPMP